MKLLVMRHGIAENQGAGKPDAERALTSEGAAKVKAVLERVRAAGCREPLIVTSPYRRARQTADLVAEVLGSKGEVQESLALTPGSSPADVWQEIRLYKKEPLVVIVGHDPLFSLLIGYLLGVPQLYVPLKKGAVAAIELEDFRPQPNGTLLWLLTAKLAGA